MQRYEAGCSGASLHQNVSAISTILSQMSTSDASAFLILLLFLYTFRIDDDILNLIDEFDFDLFLKDITNVIGHSEKWLAYITERSAIMVERFLVR